MAPCAATLPAPLWWSAAKFKSGGNEINERDVFYAPFTCESEQDFQIERSNQTASRNYSILKRTLKDSPARVTI